MPYPADPQDLLNLQPNAFPTTTTNPTIAQAAHDDLPGGAVSILDHREQYMEAHGWTVTRGTGAVAAT